MTLYNQRFREQTFISEKEWLTSRGDRDKDDLKKNERGKKYVLMTNGFGEMERVYLPEGL